MTAIEYALKWELGFEVEQVPENPYLIEDTQSGSVAVKTDNHYKVTFRRPGTAHTFTMYMSKVSEDVPTVTEILVELASAIYNVRYTDTFDDWCEELGYDRRDHKAEKLYLLIQNQMILLRDFLPAIAYNQLIKIEG